MLRFSPLVLYVHLAFNPSGADAHSPPRSPARQLSTQADFERKTLSPGGGRKRRRFCIRTPTPVPLHDKAWVCGSHSQTLFTSVRELVLVLLLHLSSHYLPHTCGSYSGKFSLCLYYLKDFIPGEIFLLSKIWLGKNCRERVVNNCKVMNRDHQEPLTRSYIYRSSHV